MSTTIAVLIFLILLTLLFGRNIVVELLGVLLSFFLGSDFYVSAVLFYVILFFIVCCILYFVYIHLGIQISVLVIATFTLIIAEIDKKYFM